MTLLAITCCQSDYTKRVNSELAKGVRQDSLLLGINFGNTRNDFYGKCYDLNKQGIVSAGAGGTVQYLFKDSLVHSKPTDLRLLFFPMYDQSDVINEMYLEFSYPAWAPWNRQFQSDSLKVKTMELLMHWYKGNDFVIANVNDSTKIPVKLDGNRRLTVETKDAQSVTVKIQDILHPRFRHSTSPIKNDPKK